MRKKKISGEIIISAVLIILGIVVMAVSAGYGIAQKRFYEKGAFLADRRSGDLPGRLFSA